MQTTVTATRRAALARVPSFFAAPPAREERESLLQNYLSYVDRRDGRPLDGQRAELREHELAALDNSSAVCEGVITKELFQRQIARFDKTVQMSAEAAALLAFVKMNSAEAYGVEIAFAERGHLYEGPELRYRAEKRAALQEHYHTRLLVGATRHFPDLELCEGWRPPWHLRVLMNTVVRVPEAVFNPLVLASELGGLAAFSWLYRRLDALFVDHPEIRDCMQARLAEVMVDEVGHIGMQRALVGPTGLAFARWLAPYTLEAVLANTPELQLLGFDRAAQKRALRTDFAELPEEIRHRSWLV